MYIEQIRRLIYGTQPNDDANITIGLVNVWLDQAIAYAAQRNYKDNVAMEGVAYVNNSFYTTFKGLAITNDGQFTWKIELPQVPLGLGTTDGISSLRFKWDNIYLSQSVIFLSEAQSTFFDNMRPIPNKLQAVYRGGNVYVNSALTLDLWTAEVSMISGGDSTDLNSTINAPTDYIPFITEYLKNQLVFQRQIPQDVANDGMDFIKTT